MSTAGGKGTTAAPKAKVALLLCLCPFAAFAPQPPSVVHYSSCLFVQPPLPYSCPFPPSLQAMKLVRLAQRDGSTAPPKSGRTQARSSEREGQKAAPKSKVCLRLYLEAYLPSSVLYVGVPDVLPPIFGGVSAVFGSYLIRLICLKILRIAAFGQPIAVRHRLFCIDLYCRLRATHRRKALTCIAAFGQTTAARHFASVFMGAFVWGRALLPCSCLFGGRSCRARLFFFHPLRSFFVKWDIHKRLYLMNNVEF